MSREIMFYSAAAALSDESSPKSMTGREKLDEYISLYDTEQ